jgi:hypothetical protein
LWENFFFKPEKKNHSEIWKYTWVDLKIGKRVMIENIW